PVRDDCRARSSTDWSTDSALTTYSERPDMTDSGQHDEPDSQRTPRPRFDALERVLAERQMPLENQRFLRPVVAAIGIAQYELTVSYITAIRADGGPDLHIYYGYTGGFVSEQ